MKFILSYLFIRVNAGILLVNTAIEPKTAQEGKNGGLGITQSYENSRAKDSTSGGTLTQFVYGLDDNAEILIEPFLYLGLSLMRVKD